jgi:hypothetical protein
VDESKMLFFKSRNWGLKGAGNGFWELECLGSLRTDSLLSVVHIVFEQCVVS